MAGLKEIKRRLKSVKNTKKITYAMKLVAAAKLQKVQEKVFALQRYQETLAQIFTQTLQSLEGREVELKLLEKRDEIKNIRLIIIGGSRGLCGGFNTNLNKKIKEVLSTLKEQYQDANIETELLGKKVYEFFKREKIEPSVVYENLGENISLWPVDEILESAKNDFLTKKIDKVYILYTKFRSALSVVPTLDELLPIDKESVTSKLNFNPALIVFEPAKEKLLEDLLPKFLRIKFMQTALDSNASENTNERTTFNNSLETISYNKAYAGTTNSASQKNLTYANRFLSSYSFWF